MPKQYITVLSIAGSDSIGGAGVQADIKTCCALGIYATTAITAVTAQNTRGVEAFKAIDPLLLKLQLDAVINDVRPDAVKVGMLPNSESIETVAACIKRHKIDKIVVDPVLVATSGHALTEQSTAEALKNLLFPLSTLITPNIPEAITLAGTGTDKEAVANRLLNCAPAVLIKGGHDENSGYITDTLYDHHMAAKSFRHPVIDTSNTHGTGCSLSTAIACFLAQNFTLSQSVERAIEWLQQAIVQGADVKFGHGHGPVNHNFLNSLYKHT